VWEPRTGDVAASGELGWLTGPSTFINRGAPDQSPRYGNYLSVWRKGPDGKWRVFIDVGTNVKAPAAFAPGFTRFRFDRRDAGKDSQVAAGESLASADRALNARIASAGAAAAYSETLAPGARVHRDGVGALTEATAVRAWLDQNAAGLSAQTRAAESAISGDLGYSYGTYQMGQSKPGAYVRIWSRDAGGRWRVVADVLQPPR
jgi:ketosteroid isomerase-like protein